MTKKLLVICGPTATGKTTIALKIAKKFNGEVVSADSRQVYKELNIGTGKDLPKNSKVQKIKYSKYSFYKINGSRVWGYDLVGPQENFSIANYIRVARSIVKDIWKRGKLPILVGGTGFYIKGVVDGIETASVPRNTKLRKSLEKKKAAELFEILAVEDPIRAGSMNMSDRKNPRRLVRAIEVAAAKPQKAKNFKPFYDEVLFLGIKKNKEELFKNIERRVQERLKNGFEKEVSKLLEMGVKWSSQSMQSLGYKEWGEFVRGEAGRDMAIKKWIKEEQKYSTRQMTWFKKEKRIKWLDLNEVEEVVRKWDN